jgi:hypothetical protein
MNKPIVERASTKSTAVGAAISSNKPMPPAMSLTSNPWPSTKLKLGRKPAEFNLGLGRERFRILVKRAEVLTGDVEGVDTPCFSSREAVTAAELMVPDCLSRKRPIKTAS